jgi:photosystem II stability/assembly factor-like uncharacterized protein
MERRPAHAPTWPRILGCLVAVSVAITLTAAIDEGVAEAEIGSWSTGGPYGGSVLDVAFDPTNPSIVYAATRNGVFRSGDGGTSWARRAAGLTDLHVGAVAVNPNHPEVIWACTSSDLFKSTDSALHWVDVAAIDCSTLALADSKPSEIFTAGYRSLDGGKTWELVTTDQVFDIAVDPTDADVVLMETVDGTFRSTDAGEHWTEVAIGDLPTGATDFTFDRANTDIVYVVSQGMHRSIDGGLTFDPLPSQPAGDVLSLALSSSVPSSIYVSTRIDHDGFVWRSTDAGDTWDPTAPVVGAGSPVVYVSEADADHVVLGTSGHGVFVSFDGGASWSHTNQGLAAATLTEIAVDPDDGRRALAIDGFSLFGTTVGGTTWEDLTPLVGDPARPNAEVFPTAVAIDATGRAFVARAPSVPNDLTFDPLLRSDDGLAWNAVGDLPAGSIVDQIVTDPNIADLLFASVRDGGFSPQPPGQLYRSDDGGVTWEGIGPSLTPVTAFARRGDGHLVVETSDSGGSLMYVSDDDGEGWTPITQPPQVIEAVVFDGSHQRIIAGSQQASKVFLSHDGGDSWVVSWLDRSNRISNITSLAVDRLDPAVIYAGTDHGGLWFSIDHGETWMPHAQGGPPVTVAALEPTVDTGLATNVAQPLYVGVTEGKKAGVYRLVPAPRNVRRPRLVLLDGGAVLEARNGLWRNAVRFSYRWFRDGAMIPDAERQRYRLRPGDRAHRIYARVTAHGPGGIRRARTLAFG